MENNFERHLGSSSDITHNVLPIDNYIDNGISCLKPIDVKVDTKNRLSELSRNVEWTNKVRLDLYETYSISENENENSVVGNFFKGILDGLLEFPGVVELYFKNEDFRKKLHEEIKHLKVSDYIDAFQEIGDNLIEGRAYLKGRSTAQVVMLATGMTGAVKAITKKAILQIPGEGIAKPVFVGIGATGLHSTGYAMTTKQEKRDHEKIKGI